MKCPHCAYSNSEGVKFCLNCGHEIVDHNENYSIFYLFAHRVDKIPRNERSVEPKFRNIFSRVFRQHSEMEAERLFIVGTGLTTPKIEEVVNTWPKPWLLQGSFLLRLSHT